MSKYVIMVELTTKGREKADELTASDESIREFFGGTGIEIEQVLLTLGRYDFVVIADAPDGETISESLLEYADMGLARTETMQAFPADQLL